MNFQDSNVEKSPTLKRLVFVPKRVFSLIICIVGLGGLAFSQGRAEYIGGTAPNLITGASGALTVGDPQYFAFYSHKSNVRVLYEKINLLEYGQTVSRRLDLAIIISPAFLLVKKRKHFLTIGYTDEEGKQQALVFRVDKNDIRAILASLEARTGQRVQFQDEEARKAGRG
jgi:hypothetical protein